MKLGIIIPWREQPSRLKAFEHVYNWYRTNFPKVTIYLPDHPGNMWLPSHTRNDGVRMAEADGCDIVIVADADTVPEFEPLQEAISDAYKDGMVHNPFNKYNELTNFATKNYFNGKQYYKYHGKRSDSACWGVVVCKISTWWELGGMDEKFIQWGLEDWAMEYAHTIIKGSKFIKHDGFMFSFYHLTQPKHGSETYSNNEKIYNEYLKIKDKEQLLDFIKS